MKTNARKTPGPGLALLSGIIFFALSTGANFNSAECPDSNEYASKIDSFIRKAISVLDFKAGFSISVVKNNETIFSKGYGYRNIEDKLPVTEDTPFYIASATKSFVAAAAKILADEGRLDLDSPISRYLPDLHFNPPLSTETISIRDLLTHRSGIENSPVGLRTAFTGDQTDSLVLKLLDSSIFKGHQFRYTNLGYVLTGLIIKKVTGKTWQEIVEEKIFKPLDMNSTHCKVSLYNQKDLALPYSITNNKVTMIRTIKDDKMMHAAGGIITTAKDAANWLKFNVDNGMFNNNQLFPVWSMEELHSAQITLSAKFYNYKRFAYGLGWYLSDYNGELLIHHFGGYSGFRSHISFMPQYKTGVAAFVNDDSEGYFLPDLAADYVYNLLSGKKDYDSIGEKELADYKLLVGKLREKSAQKDQSNAPGKFTSDELNNLIGSYFNSQFGRLEVIRKDSSLIARMGSLSGEITKSAEGTYKVEFSAFSSIIEVELGDDKHTAAALILSSIPWPDKKFLRIKEQQRSAYH